MSVRRYTENQAAVVLGTPRSTLSLRRRNGWVRPDVIVKVDQPASSNMWTFYNADLVDAVAAGEQSLYRAEE